MTKRERNARAGFSFGVFVFVASFLIVAAGCEATPCKTWNPATTPPQCQACETAPDGSTRFVGPFLSSDECTGEPTPIVINPEVQP